MGRGSVKDYGALAFYPFPFWRSLCCQLFAARCPDGLGRLFICSSALWAQTTGTGTPVGTVVYSTGEGSDPDC